MTWRGWVPGATSPRSIACSTIMPSRARRSSRSDGSPQRACCRVAICRHHGASHRRNFRAGCVGSGSLGQLKEIFSQGAGVGDGDVLPRPVEHRLKHQVLTCAPAPVKSGLVYACPPGDALEAEGRIARVSANSASVAAIAAARTRALRPPGRRPKRHRSSRSPGRPIRASVHPHLTYTNATFCCNFELRLFF